MLNSNRDQQPLAIATYFHFTRLRATRLISLRTQNQIKNENFFGDPLSTDRCDK